MKAYAIVKKNGKIRVDEHEYEPYPAIWKKKASAKNNLDEDKKETVKEVEIILIEDEYEDLSF